MAPARVPGVDADRAGRRELAEDERLNWEVEGVDTTTELELAAATCRRSDMATRTSTADR
jgi:hypothetical protein